MDNFIQKMNKWFSIVFKRHESPPFLIFFITSRCELKCKHCFYWQNIKTQAEEDLSIEEIEGLSKHLGVVHSLLISGGEPFLREDLSKICGIFYQNNKVNKIAIPTNGFSPEKICDRTKEISSKYPNVKFEISLSLDGLRDVHDDIRGVSGTFDRVLETYDSLMQLKRGVKNLKVYIVTTISNKNIDDLIQFKKFASVKFKDSDGHRFAFFRGSAEDKNVFFPAEELDNISHILMECKKNTRLDNIFLNAKIASLKQRRQIVRCMAGKLIGVIDSNGDVRLCELHDPIGNIRKENFHDIWHSTVADAQRAKIKNKHCYCTHECFIAPSILYSCRNLFKSVFVK